MKITIEEKNYETDNFEHIDSIDRFSWKEFLYFTETLYKTEEEEYILEISWQIDPEWAKNEIEDGLMSKSELESKTEYRIICDEEKEAWLEESVWEV